MKRKVDKNPITDIFTTISGIENQSFTSFDYQEIRINTLISLGIEKKPSKIMRVEASGDYIFVQNAPHESKIKCETQFINGTKSSEEKIIHHIGYVFGNKDYNKIYKLRKKLINAWIANEIKKPSTIAVIISGFALIITLFLGIMNLIK